MQYISKLCCQKISSERMTNMCRTENQSVILKNLPCSYNSFFGIPNNGLIPLYVTCLSFALKLFFDNTILILQNYSQKNRDGLEPKHWQKNKGKLFSFFVIKHPLSQKEFQLSMKTEILSQTKSNDRCSHESCKNS